MKSLANAPALRARQSYASILPGFEEGYPLLRLVRDLEQILSSILGHRYVADPTPSVFTQANLAWWRRFNMLPIWLPELVYTPEFELKLLMKFGQMRSRGVRPWVGLAADFHYRIRGLDSFAPWIVVKRGWYLVDLTPNSVIGRVGDVLGSAISPHPTGSRLGITPDDWESVICPTCAKQILKVGKYQEARLESAVEYILISNLFATERFSRDVQEWFHDSPRGTRLYRGSVITPLNDLKLEVGCYTGSEDSFENLAGRPIIRF